MVPHPQPHGPDPHRDGGHSVLAGSVGCAVDHYFQNGGSSARVVRVAHGVDGAPPTDEILGTRADKTGLYALEDVPAFNVLDLPDVLDLHVLKAALAYAEDRRSMILFDMGPAVQAAADWIADRARAGLRRPNAAVYFPRVVLSDPLDGGRLRSFASTGVIAGLGHASLPREECERRQPAGRRS